MENNLDKHIVAYSGQSLYDFDNEIILNWYPYRIMETTQNAKSILELGLGHGFTTQIFASHFDHHIVLEGSAAVINRFKSIAPDCPAEIIETYFEDFESEEKFDVIVFGFILEHVDNPVQILKHFKKFLSSNGKIFISVPNAEALNRRLGYEAGLLQNIFELSDSDIEQGHKRYYTVKSLSEEISNADLQIERLEGIYLKPFTTKQIKSLKLKKNIINAMCRIGIDYPELSLAILAEAREGK